MLVVGVSKTEKGFTLLEVLVVILVLSILIAVVTFRGSGLLGTKAEELGQTQLSTLRMGLSAAIAQGGIGYVNPGTVGVDGDSMTPAAEVEILPGIGLDTYIQPDIKGKWTWNRQGVVTYGLFRSGGKTFEFNGCTWTKAKG